MRPTEGAWRVAATYTTQAEVDTEEARAKKQGETLRLTITYMDPGPLPAEMTIAAPGMTLKTKP